MQEGKGVMAKTTAPLSGKGRHRTLPFAMLAFFLCLAGSPPREALAAPPEFPNRELVVGTKEAPPFAMKAPDGSWTGLSIDLWRQDR